MYFDDYDYDDVVEQSKLDEIMSETIEKINAVVKDDVKATLSEAQTAESKVVQLRGELARLESEINHKKAETERLIARFEQLNQYDLPRGVVEKAVKAVTSDFVPGQEVFCITSKGVRAQCPTCNGNKKITIAIGGNKREIECPDCRGYGYKTEYVKEITQKTVKNIHLTLCFNDNRISYWESDVLYFHGEDYRSSNKDVYATKEEAEARLKELKGE